MKMRREISLVCFIALWLLWPVRVVAQSPVPLELHGDEEWQARGFMFGNLIHANIKNSGVVGDFIDPQPGAWPTPFNWHIDGIALFIGGKVPGDRTSSSLLHDYYGGRPDTSVTPVVLRYVDYGTKLGPRGDIWGWLPLPGFHNPNRIDPITGLRDPQPATSSDVHTWPDSWPDKSGNPDDPGWRGTWNGLFGKDVFNADWEVYYVMDDWQYRQFMLDPITGLPNSQYGVFYPDAQDSTRGGLGLQVQVRALQWANILAEDAMFLVYRINNVGTTPHDSLFFSNLFNFRMEPEGDEAAAFDPLLDIAYGWDSQGFAVRNGIRYNTGYTGEAFLESPSRDMDGLDNDEDGIIDESRTSGSGMLIEGQDAIRAYVESNYIVPDFVRTFGEEGQSLDDVLNSRPAFQAGRWWTGDEDLDWVGFDDANGNGVWDEGELLNDDRGLDGLGPNDPGYPGPDSGEGNGMADCVIGQGCEANFDQLDIEESDQIGLTGFDLGSRPFYSDGGHMLDDSWMWDRIIHHAQFPLGTEPQIIEDAGLEPLLIFTSGPVELASNTSDFFSIAWLFGADEEDFMRNRRVVQTIYDADYNFARPPLQPTLTAVPGDGQVVLSWDDVSLQSFDRFTQRFDFEGFKLYKGTDENLSDALLISDSRGIPSFRRPIGQWDLRNGITGRVPALNGEVMYELGTDSGLQFSYVDRDVQNGQTYYYAIVAYDHGDIDPTIGRMQPTIDPQENVFNFTLDRSGQVIGNSVNAAIVTPRPRPAGYVEGAANEDLSSPTGTLSPDLTSPLGTGALSVRVANEDAIYSDHVYRMSFDSENDPENPAIYRTVAYTIEDRTNGETLLEDAPLSATTPVVDGFIVDILNENLEVDRSRTGWVSQEGAMDVHALDPSELDGVETNWIASLVTPTTNPSPSPHDYELEWRDSTQLTERFAGGLIATEIPVFCTNVTTGQACNLFVRDHNGSGTFDVGDALLVFEREGPFRPPLVRFEVLFESRDASVPPTSGTRFRISQRRPFFEGDYFDFTLTAPSIDTELAARDLDKIAVVPNPYVGAAAWEPRSLLTGRGPRRVQFIHLPQECTISIYNLRGELIKTLYHNDSGSNGAIFWDLLSDGGQEIAPGTYFFHVNASGIGETTGKFSIVK